MCVRQVDLAFNHMPQAGAFSGQDHFDFELSFSGQLLLAHRALDGLLRGNTNLLEVFPHRNIEVFHPNLLPGAKAVNLLGLRISQYR
jgi:hypothetical protein